MTASSFRNGVVQFRFVYDTVGESIGKLSSAAPTSFIRLEMTETLFPWSAGDRNLDATFLL